MARRSGPKHQEREQQAGYDEGMTDPPHTVRAAPSRALRRMWPYAVVILTGAVLWIFVWGTHLQSVPDSASDATVVLTGTLMLLDVILGIIAVSILPLRHRAPLAIAILIAAMLTLSASASGVAVLAVVHIAIVGTRLGLIIVGGVWTLALLGNDALIASALGTGTNTTETAVSTAAGLLLYVVLVAIGRYRRARSETLRLLRERADNAEREREREVKAAKESERVRIAREMHDVLAHRISLVSMHAGALTYREDLPREKVTEAAQVIQQSAALALKELRELLGVLRDTQHDEPHMPQPTLAQLAVLLAESRAAGSVIDLQITGIDAPDEQPRTEGLDPLRSRTAYRIVQEALTNARKHAPGQPVHLRIGRENDRLMIETRNRIPLDSQPTVLSGMGLVGLTERVHLAGGTLTSGPAAGEFVLTAWIPWI